MERWFNNCLIVMEMQILVQLLEVDDGEVQVFQDDQLHLISAKSNQFNGKNFFLIIYFLSKKYAMVLICNQFVGGIANFVPRIR